MIVRSRLLSWRSSVFLSTSYAAFPARLDAIGAALMTSGATMGGTVLGSDFPPEMGASTFVKDAAILEVVGG